MASRLAKALLLFGASLVPATSEERRKILIILGAPCAGCGTESPSIINALDIPHLDTGGMLRDAALAGTPAGKTAGKMMKEGVLVTDDIVNKIVADRIAQPDCAKGFLLDGYPRNEAQSKTLDEILAKTGEKVTDVLYLDVPMHALQQCVLHRWTSDGGDEWTSGYKAFRYPKSFLDLAKGTKPQCERDDLKNCNMWDDWNGSPLFRRADDNLKTLAERVKIFHEQTGPVLEHYKAQGTLRDINGYQEQPKVWGDIAKVIGADPAKGLAALPHPASEPEALPFVALVGAMVFGVASAVIYRTKEPEVSEYILVE